MNKKKIMIIGGTGALGKTLISHYHKDNEIIVFSRDEHKHVKLKHKYKNIKFQFYGLLSISPFRLVLLVIS